MAEHRAAGKSDAGGVDERSDQRKRASVVAYAQAQAVQGGDPVIRLRKSQHERTSAESKSRRRECHPSEGCIFKHSDVFRAPDQSDIQTKVDFESSRIDSRKDRTIFRGRWFPERNNRKIRQFRHCRNDQCRPRFRK